MGIMDTLFGKDPSSDEANRLQKEQNDKLMAFITELLQTSRTDISNLMDQSRKSADKGFEKALDLTGQSGYTQQNQLRQGNRNAQNRLIDAQAGIEAALWGTPPPNTHAVASNIAPAELFKNKRDLAPSAVGKVSDFVDPADKANQSTNPWGSLFSQEILNAGI